MKPVGRLFCVLALLVFSACGLLVEEGRQVLAEVGGEPIRLDDLVGRIREMPFEKRARTNDSDESVRLKARRSVLEVMVIEMLLAKEAQARNMKVSDEEVELAFAYEEGHDNGLNNSLEGMKGAATGHEHAGDMHSRREIEQMREKLMIERMLQQQFSDAVLQRYYGEHIQEFVISPPVASHELLVVDASNSEVIDMVYQMAARDGTTLAAAIASLEDVPPLVFLGTTPLTPLNRIVPSMREKVEKLELGQVSKPFHLRPPGAEQYGVARLVHVIDKVSFKNAKEKIYRKLYKDFIDELQQKYEVVYHEEKLNYKLRR